MGFSAAPNGATNKFFSAIDQHSFHAPSVGDGPHPWKDPSQNNKDFTPTLRRTRLGSDVSRKHQQPTGKRDLSRYPAIYYPCLWQVTEHYWEMHTVRIHSC